MDFYVATFITLAAAAALALAVDKLAPARTMADEGEDWPEEG